VSFINLVYQLQFIVSTFFFIPLMHMNWKHSFHDDAAYMKLFWSNGRQSWKSWVESSDLLGYLASIHWHYTCVCSAGGWECVKRRKILVASWQSWTSPACLQSLSFFSHVEREICIQIKGKKFLFSQFTENLGRRQRNLDGANMEHNIMAWYHDENEWMDGELY
jgi:hypothetical protein